MLWFFTHTFYFMLSQIGSRSKQNEVKLALNNEDGELIVKGGFYGASFSTIDTLNENDDNIEEDNLNWYILVIYILLMMVFFYDL